MNLIPKPLKQLYDDLCVTESTAAGRASQARTSVEDPFVLKLANLILSYSLQIRASDIHIEPAATSARVRYRIDGLLHEMLQLPQETRDPLLRAMKLKANMVNEPLGRSKPQDGRFSLESNGRQVSLRLSSFPTLFGDVLSIRILDSSASVLGLDQVGFPPDILKAFIQLIKRPNGMLLVTGPAGSGKTTTLYAALNALRSPHVKIVTLEDPVEYQVDGIDQAQVNTAVGMTFASGLRAILRQDANIILIGEIRDKETAEIAIRAALTGHLVFSTMHTRNALGAIARLMDMGVEPHLILASINGLVAQRLVRRLCPSCRQSDALAGKTFERLWARQTGTAPTAEQIARVNRAIGCGTCQGIGYRGRMGIFELLVMDGEIKQLVLDHRSLTDSRLPGRLGSFRSMLFSGLEQVAAGLTTIEEVLRVTGEGEEAAPQ